MFFVPKKEEAGAQVLFKKNCTTHGLSIELSLKALTALRHVAEEQAKGNRYDINDRDAHTLGRRGMIRLTGAGEPLLTQMGMQTLALAEAGGLLTVKVDKKEVA